MRRRVVAGCVLALALTTAPQSAAQPEVPAPPPWVPLEPTAFPGDYSYLYNVIAVGPPPTSDARGVRVASNVDPAAQSVGLPGDMLGNGPLQPGPLVTSNARYGISAGMEPAGTNRGGVDISSGNARQPTGENPTGAPPSTPPEPESTMPTTLQVPDNPELPVDERPQN
jgi:hypothetical protein